MSKYILVTRHSQLINYVLSHVLPESSGVEVRSHVEAEDIEDRNVIGLLPLNLAKHAASITIIPLINLPSKLRGRELTKKQLKKYAGPPKTFIVKEVRNPWE